MSSRPLALRPYGSLREPPVVVRKKQRAISHHPHPNIFYTLVIASTLVVFGTTVLWLLSSTPATLFSITPKTPSTPAATPLTKPLPAVVEKPAPPAVTPPSDFAALADFSIPASVITPGAQLVGISIPPSQPEPEKPVNPAPALDPAPQPTPGAHIWTREKDGATFEGKFLGYKEGSIDEIWILKNDDQKEYPISLNTLVDADRDFVMMEITKLTPTTPNVTDAVPPPAEVKRSPATKPVNRTWTLRDHSQYAGSYLRSHNGNVVIKLQRGGRPKSLPYSQLSMADQNYVDEINKTKPAVDTKSDGTVITVEAQPEIATGLAAALAKLDSLPVAPITSEVQQLIDTFNDDLNKARATRLEALKSLGYMNDRAAPALPFLRHLLLRKDPEVRRLVLEVMEKIGAPSVPAFVAILESMRDPTEFCLEGFWHLGPKSNEGDNLTLAWRSLKALGRLGPQAKAAMPVLLDLSTMSERTFSTWQEANDKHKGFPVPDATYFCATALQSVRLIRPDEREISTQVVKVLKLNVSRLQYLDRNDTTARNAWSSSSQKTLREALVNQCITALNALCEMSPPPKESVTPAQTLIQGHYAIKEAITLLGKCGSEATVALDILRPLLNHGDFEHTAEAAIAQITRRE